MALLFQRQAPDLHSMLLRELRTVIRPQTAHTPAPVLPPMPADCAVCLGPLCTRAPSGDAPPSTLKCSCGLRICRACVPDLVASELSEGHVPSCIRCTKKLPALALAPFIDRPQLAELARVCANEQSRVEAVFKATCPGCHRTTSLQAATSTGQMRFACSHCEMRMCAVCQHAFPLSGPADELVHRPCAARFVELLRFQELLSLLEDASLRHCPRCDETFVKDGACTHMSHCTARFCYVCLLDEATLPQGRNLNHHGVYSLEWIGNPASCPMYLHHLAHVDPRVAAAGCSNPRCRPADECVCDPRCREQRDWVAQSLLATMRVRYALLEFMGEMGVIAFERLVRTFGFCETIDANYFNSSFPWGTETLPHVVDFEPESMRGFYRERASWYQVKRRKRCVPVAALAVPLAGGAAAPQPPPPPPPIPPVGHRLHIVRAPPPPPPMPPVGHRLHVPGPRAANPAAGR